MSSRVSNLLIGRNDGKHKLLFMFAVALILFVLNKDIFLNLYQNKDNFTNINNSIFELLRPLLVGKVLFIMCLSLIQYSEFTIITPAGFCHHPSHYHHHCRHRI